MRATRPGKLMNWKILWDFLTKWFFFILLSLHDEIKSKSLKENNLRKIAEQRKLAQRRELNALEKCQTSKRPGLNKSESVRTENNFGSQNLQLQNDLNESPRSNTSLSSLKPREPTEKMVKVFTIPNSNFLHKKFLFSS